MASHLPSHRAWHLPDRILDLSRPCLMGIVNVTPDSFSDGGQFYDAQRAIAHGLQLLADGAQILDVGGESTRPGAAEVPVAQEIDRVMPVIEGLLAAGAVVSIDTRKPEVMAVAAAQGVQILNDISGFESPAAQRVASESNCALVTMHMRGTPATMQHQPDYRDVVAEVQCYLEDSLMRLQAAGVAPERVVLDPGFGFGKTLAHNLQLFKALRSQWCGRPLLVGVSRKSMLGQLLGGRDAADRVLASAVAAVAAVKHGARLLRVHDVAATRDALLIWDGLAGDSE